MDGGRDVYKRAGILFNGAAIAMDEGRDVYKGRRNVHKGETTEIQGGGRVDISPAIEISGRRNVPKGAAIVISGCGPVYTAGGTVFRGRGNVHKRGGDRDGRGARRVQGAPE